MSNQPLVQEGIWAFVLNRIEVDAELPYEIAPDSYFERANDLQVNQIREALNQLAGNSVWFRPTDLYERDLLIESGGFSFGADLLPRTQWRYYVVTSPDNGRINNDLHLVSNISETPLELSGLHFFQHMPGQGFRPTILHHHFSNLQPRKPRKLNAQSLKEIRTLYDGYTGNSGSPGVAIMYPEIQRALSMYDSLSFLLPDSDFHVLGLFAIIEMLITHNPKLDDRGDSITHQMQSKIPLLSHRFDRVLSVDAQFPGVTDKKVWAALYKFRSALAHGGQPDFSDRDLRVLKSANHAKDFLRDAVKALLRHSLKEPQLFRDLREC